MHEGNVDDRRSDRQRQTLSAADAEKMPFRQALSGADPLRVMWEAERACPPAYQWWRGR